MIPEIGTFGYPIVIALLGSLHCMGMCGGFVVLLGKNNQGTGWYWLYQAGKTLGYALIGTLVLAFSFILTRSAGVTGSQYFLTTLSGYLMCHYAVVALMGKSWSFTGKLPGWLRPEKALHNPFLFGIFNGLMPCGLVYMLFIALPLADSVAEGYLMILLFGAGTIPSLFLIGKINQYLSGSGRNWVEKILYVYLLLFGIVTLLRGNSVTEAFVHSLFPHSVLRWFIF
ncbi:MAG: sulfite exporter TauE/SafE family protein [Bacteroidetes bacterium]|nr:sulfite exporter TauE/SafE family protein [Bacteroidota bacterium]